MNNATTTIIEVEKTGPVTRVYVSALEEDDALDAAKEHLSTDALGEVVYHSEGAGAVFEVIFETADLI